MIRPFLADWRLWVAEEMGPHTHPRLDNTLMSRLKGEKANGIRRNPRRGISAIRVLDN
jgi:hypothetical protein